MGNAVNQPWYVSHAESLVQNIVGQVLYAGLMWSLSIPLHTAVTLQVGGFFLSYVRTYAVRRAFNRWDYLLQRKAK